MNAARDAARTTRRPRSGATSARLPGPGWMRATIALKRSAAGRTPTAAPSPQPTAISRSRRARGSYETSRSSRLRSVAVRIEARLATEEVVDAGGVEDHEGHPDDGHDQHHAERVVGCGRVRRREVVRGVRRRDEEVRVDPDARRDD